jgi:hypothetical protein
MFMPIGEPTSVGLGALDIDRAGGQADRGAARRL